MNQTAWRADFHETCQDLQEDVFLLEVLAEHVLNGGGGAALPQALKRLSDYLSQHALDLRNLDRRLEGGDHGCSRSRAYMQ